MYIKQVCACVRDLAHTLNMDHELQTNAIEQGVSCVIARRAIPSVCVYACVC